MVLGHIYGGTVEGCREAGGEMLNTIHIAVGVLQVLVVRLACRRRKKA